MSVKNKNSTRRSKLSGAKQALLEKRLRGENSRATSTQVILPRAEQGPASLSFSQQRLWFLDRFDPGASTYNIPNALYLQGPLHLEALQQSLTEIMRRHEILRTIFVAENEEPVQVVTAPESFNLVLVDLQHLPELERKAEARRLASEETLKPFDLAQGPLLRATLIQLDQEEHVLILVMHHIVYDGWSSGVFNHELSTLYEAYATGQPWSLPELPIQYADFAAWQQQWATGETLKAQLDYWKEQLGNRNLVLELPTDHARPAMQSFNGATRLFNLPQPLSESLKTLSRAEDATMFMTLLAAFKALLYRYTRQTDIVVGTPIAGRNYAELEGLIGFFVNTLAMATDLSGNPSFRELLERVRNGALEAYAHQDLPFEKIVEALQPGRNTSHSPIFQVMFVFNAPGEAVHLKDLTISEFDFDIKIARFDLTLYMWEEAGRLAGALEYNTDLFEEATIIRLLGHLQTLLQGAVSNPDQPITRLPLLTEAEQQQLLVTWNDTRTPRLPDECIHQMFEAQVTRTPDEVAVIFGQKQLTYRQLNQQANQLAHHLRKLGVKPGELVAISMERSLEMIIGVLATLKAGGAYVPLDPEYPQNRLAFMLEDTGALVLLTQQQLVDSLPAHKSHPLCLDTEWATIARENTDNLPNEAMGENLAYVIYTSGSTGKPKGVAMVHRALSNLIAWQLKESPLSTGARTLQFASLSFDVSCQEMFATWGSGGTLVLVSEKTRRDTVSLLHFLTDQKIERLFLPFIALQHIAEVADTQGLMPTTLREVVTAGEQLQTTPHIMHLFEAVKECKLHNQYGPSESHVITAYTLQGAPADWPALPPIGRPIDNSEIYLLDADLQPVPIGVPGELYLGGVCLADGYLHRPDLTAEKFVAHPFSNRPEARLYKTGDLGRYLPDGNIEFLGRIDHQVKIRGFRIELGEIETTLAQHPNVQENVVIVREDQPGDKRLVAYVVLAQTQEKTSTRNLRRFLQERLPDYMVPATFVFLDAMPLTPSGKISRRTLPVPDQARPDMDKIYIAPRNDTEEKLTKIWEALLGVQPIGVTDNYFELGGHSLLAVRMFTQIEKVFGINLPLATLFQDATIEYIANVLEQKTGRETWSSLVEIQPKGTKPPFFCVHGGTGDVLWFRELAHYLGQDQPFYGLQSKGLDGIQEPISTIEEMAAHYLNEIRIVQPEGPYHLGGYCFGGVVVLEMAQQLQAQGQQVNLLAILSSIPPNINYHFRKASLSPEYIGSFVSNIPHWLTNLREIGVQQAVTRLKRKAIVYKKVLTSNNPQFEAGDIVDDAEQLPEHRRKLIKVNDKASLQYKPQVYEGPITVFQPRTPPMFYVHHLGMGWPDLAGGEINVKVVPGSHQSIFKEPRVQVLATELTKALTMAQEQAPAFIHSNNGY